MSQVTHRTHAVLNSSLAADIANQPGGRCGSLELLAAVLLLSTVAVAVVAVGHVLEAGDFVGKVLALEAVPVPVLPAMFP